LTAGSLLSIMLSGSDIVFAKENTMKNRSKTLLVGATAFTLIALSLAACDSNVPGKKSVQPKPTAAVPVDAAGANFKGEDTMKSTDNVPKEGKDGKPAPK